MEQTNQPKTQRDRSTTFALPPTRSTPDPLETPASRSPRQSRFERLREVYETLSCANEDTDATADAIALNDLNASQPAPAGPCTNDPSTSTNAKNSSETTRSSTSIRTRIGRLFAQAQPSTHPTPRLRLLPNISISRLSFLHHGRGSSSSMSMPNTHIVYSSDGRAVFEYDPYTVRGTTPPLAGPFDFSLTSQESRMWRPGQGQQRRLRAGSEGSQWRTQRSLNPGVGPARNDGGLSSYGYERAYGRGYAYGQGQRRGEWGTAAAAAAQREREPNANSSSRPRGGNGSGSVQAQAPPRIHGPAPRRRRADSTMTTAMINEESEQPHASSSHVPNRSRSRSVIPSPSSSVYSEGTAPSIDDTCSSIGCACWQRNADEEADKADRANNDDTGGLMVLDGPADDDPAPWPQATRPAPGRTDSYASSLALLRWEASQPGSPYPSPFRPGLATLTLKRQRERREARQREQQAAAEEERKTRRRSVSASAALMSAAEEDDDGAYAAALASLDNPRSASASAVLMNDDDADDDGVYAAALANMPLPMPVPPETDEIVVGAIEALREECEGEAMRQRSRRGGVLAKLKQDVQNMKPRARGGADSGSKKKLFRRTW
ncbi:hypothetical protein IWX90DRAFT_417908 [Phyllosticta citrichinensis]|uniref:Uncharacterized protein n=1 Tax=Phyllosticta citrichinensis TaxID=1130410 RepID=A0ABR1XJ99_9PEZI